MIEIKGFTKTSLVDWDGKIASVIFLPFCNFDCGFCHSSELVKNPGKLSNISESDIFNFLESKKGWIDGIVITGGEPTLHQKELTKLVRKIKSLGFLVKLDSNGTDPELLEKMIKENIIDYVAMDIKTSKESYEKVTSTKVDIKKINQSVKILLAGKADYEFRTTVVPGLVEREDIIKIGEWIADAKLYALQQFRNIDVMDAEFLNVKPYPKEKLEEFGKLLKGKVKKVKIRAS